MSETEMWVKILCVYFRDLIIKKQLKAQGTILPLTSLPEKI